MKVLLMLGFSLVMVQADADETSWNSFQIQNRNIYKNRGEQQLRQRIFNENLDKIEEHNKKYEQGLVSYKLGVNKFADLTDEEFTAKFKILQVDEQILEDGHEKHDLTNKEIKNELPESIDWREKSVVTEVKNQGQCGGCWAFSATGTIESQIAIQTGELKSLSEQQLIDCDTGNYGCNGGAVQYAINYVTTNGITLEEDYPYQGEQQTCNTTKSKDNLFLTKGYIGIKRNNETDLKNAVGLAGPVSVAINATLLKSYQEGILDGACSDTLNHGVLAVGYGIDNTTGTEYWIMKNSWGKDWGDQGYFKLRMGTNLCGVAKQACYALITKTDNSDDGNSGYSVKGVPFSYLVTFIYILILVLQ